MAVAVAVAGAGRGGGVAHMPAGHGRSDVLNLGLRDGPSQAVDGGADHG